jgi:hypothetical protein
MGWGAVPCSAQVPPPSGLSESIKKSVPLQPVPNCVNLRTGDRPVCLAGRNGVHDKGNGVYDAPECGLHDGDRPAIHLLTSHSICLLWTEAEVPVPKICAHREHTRWRKKRWAGP